VATKVARVATKVARVATKVARVVVKKNKDTSEEHFTSPSRVGLQTTKFSRFCLAKQEVQT
jgi:hypothetical protein